MGGYGGLQANSFNITPPKTNTLNTPTVAKEEEEETCSHVTSLPLSIDAKATARHRR
jgi:hypothetical protein